jgi:GDPmannose 4,6-dehydratase
MKKKALITGITGQDGSYLAELLLEKDYEVYGVLRRASVFTTERIGHILDHPNLRTFWGDLTDSSNINRLVQKIQPDEIYNLAAQSHVKVSFEVPEYTGDVDGIGALRILDAIKGGSPHSRYYQASTSELFGDVREVPQNENTPFYPRSPYAAAKLYAYWITINYREAYNIYACNGVLFNHESERRDPRFVTRKITQAVAKISCGIQCRIELGNIYAKRDWGHAADYVEAMWLMMQQDVPDDYVISTGEAYSVKEFCEMAFKVIGIKLKWVGSGLDEIAINMENKETLISINQEYFRPTEVELLIGDSSKAKKVLNWQPKISFQQLVYNMVSHDISLINGEL